MTLVGTIIVVLALGGIIVSAVISRRNERKAQHIALPQDETEQGVEAGAPGTLPRADTAA
jgi:hypothetical protein